MHAYSVALLVLANNERTLGSAIPLHVNSKPQDSLGKVIQVSSQETNLVGPLLWLKLSPFTVSEAV